MPNTTSQLHSLTISGEYKLQTNFSILAGYTFERFLYDDAGLSALSNPTQYGNALLPGIETPSYVAHVIRVAARLKF